MTDNKSIVDLYTKVISEQARKERGELVEAKVSYPSNLNTKEYHAVPDKVKNDKDAHETVSKDKDHEITSTSSGHDGEHDYYHGHVGGKHFSVKLRSSYHGDDNYTISRHYQQNKHEASAGLKAHGITGADHKKVLGHILKRQDERNGEMDE